MSKQNYFARITKKLTNVSKNCKLYWSIPRRLLNNTETPLIPPLFHENKIVTDFKEKLELFNSHFATHCPLISNSSKPPSDINSLTGNRLSFLSLSHDEIAKVIHNLDPNKARGYDNIRARMMKVCGRSVYKPLEIIFNQSLESGVFQSE